MKDTKFTRIALIVFTVAAVTIFGVQAFALNGPSYKSIPGSVITDTLVVGNTGYSFAIADTNYLKGGHMQVSNQAELLNIGVNKTVTLERRSLGMLVTVLDDGVADGNQTVTYRLINEPGTVTTSISDWAVVLPGTTEGYNAGVNKYLTVDGTGNFVWGTPNGGGGGGIPYKGAISNVDLGIHDLTVDTNSLFVNSTNHRVGVGTINPLYTLDVNGVINTNSGINVFDMISQQSRSMISGSRTYTGNTSSNYYGNNIEAHIATSGVSSSVVAGIFGGYSEQNTTGGIGGIYSLASVTNPVSVGSVYGVEGVPIINNTGATVTNFFNAIMGRPTITKGTVEKVINLWARADLITGGNTNNYYGAYIDGPTAGTILNDYGLYIGNQSKGSNLNYSLYSAGGKSYFADNVGMGITDPTSLLNLKAGTTSPGTSPLKFTPGENLSTSEAGAIEYDGSHLYFTATDGGERFQLDQQSGGGSSPVSIINNSNLFSTGLLGTGSGVTSTTNSNFFGYDTGNQATNASNSNFFGSNAGNFASNAYESNFIGYSAGNQAVDAYESNFFGYSAGDQATNASYSNFIGYSAGNFATDAYNSNFFGSGAGQSAINASNSIFIGQSAGAYDTVDNNISGTGNDWSILLGSNTNTGGFSNSILLGGSIDGNPISNTKTNQFMLAPSITEMKLSGVDYTLPSTQAVTAGDVLTNDGTGILTWAAGGSGGSSPIVTAGNGLTKNGDVISLGGIISSDVTVTGYGYNVNFGQPAGQPLSSFNVNAGYNLATNNSGFKVADQSGGQKLEIGFSNGFNFTSNGGNYLRLSDNGNGFYTYLTGGSYFNLNPSSGLSVLTSSGNKILLDNNDNFFAGKNTGSNINLNTNDGFSVSTLSGNNIILNNSNNFFIGKSAGLSTVGMSQSNFIGYDAGNAAVGSSSSNFIGQGAGKGATAAPYSNFLGLFAGQSAANSSNSNFIGNYAGNTASGASNSNFLGNHAGNIASNASNSNFLGDGAGASATNAFNSNFFGQNSGNSSSSNNSNFFGKTAGASATNASYSNFFGSGAGQSAINASNSIFIGKFSGIGDTVDNNISGTGNDWSILLGSNTNTGGFSNSILLGGSIDGNPISNTKTNQFMLAPSITEMKLSGVDYTLPSTQAVTAGDVLTNDGTGILTWAAGGTGGGSSPISVVNSTSLVSTGLTGSGSGATSVTNSNFFGVDAGYSATGSSNSNFFGQESGTYAFYAPNSNFFGPYSGYYAANASNSNFFGQNAGNNASNASNSIFIGQSAGYSDIVNNTSNGLSSILIGSFTNTGGFSNSILLGSGIPGSYISNTKINQFMLAPSITEMQLRGIDYTLPLNQASAAGDVLTNDGFGGLTWAAGSTGGGGSSPISVVGNNNLFSVGLAGTGSGTGTITNSNFFGRYAGNLAPGASDSNFFGSGSGDGATSAYESNFLGNSSGYSATGASNSNFLGTNSGYNAISAYESNFLGFSSGYSATSAFYSNFLGTSAGYKALNASGSNFLGLNSGYNASGAYDSNFLGTSAGNTATTAYKSNFLGFFAGNVATNAYESNFMGYYAGNGATGASDSNFLGFSSGESAISAYDSNFLGYKSGYFASGASNSNFIGATSGQSATNAYQSNFIGAVSGYQAINAYNSNFLGSYSGNLATNASNSNFLGQQAGSSAFNASNSIFIGQLAGLNDIVNNTTNVDDFSILIGKSTSTGGFKNSIALGGSSVNTAVNQFMIGSSTRPINTTVWSGASGVACTFTTAVGAMNCTSDSSMKKNITDLNGNIFNKYGDSTNPYTEGSNSIDISKLNTLDKILALTPVTYNWDYELDTDQSHIGFIAQEVKQIFPNLVSKDINTNKLSLNITGLTPYIVEAIQELDLKVTGINNLDIDNNIRNNLISWFSNTSNKISEFIAGTIRAKDKLCIGEGIDEVCITKEELLQMKTKTTTFVPFVVATPVIPITPVTPVVIVPIVEAPVIKEIPIVEKEKEITVPVITPIVITPTTPEIKVEKEPSLPVISTAIIPVAANPTVEPVL